MIAHRLGGRGEGNGIADLDELACMLQSGSDRVGALDFQASPEECVPREADNETLERLLDSADRVDRGLPLAPDLAEALQHGAAIGGARPKALIRDGETQCVAKFPSSTDTLDAVKSEFIAMRLASAAGLSVAPVRLVRAMSRDVLLVRRFDREPAEHGWTRRAVVSALTLLGLDERMAAHASYAALADIVRARLSAPAETLEELFARMTFNILVGNADDHARNHAAFWDGETLALTPAYDVCAQSRTGREASQAMRIHGRERRSQLSLCLAAANKFCSRTSAPWRHAPPNRRHRRELGHGLQRGAAERGRPAPALAAPIPQRSCLRGARGPARRPCRGSFRRVPGIASRPVPPNASTPR